MNSQWHKAAMPAIAAIAFLVAIAGCGRETGTPGFETYIVRKPWGGKTEYVQTLHGVESTALNIFYETAEEIDMRPKRYEEEFNITVEGDVNIQFRAHIVVAVRPDRSKEIVEKLGRGKEYYEARIQKPFRDRVRGEVTKYKVFDVKDHRDDIAKAILVQLRKRFEGQPFFILDVLTGNIDYDTRVKSSAVRAIIKKEELNQREIQLQIQLQDNKIRETEAEATEQAQAIVRGSLTARYNKWNGLRAIAGLAGYADDSTTEATPPENITFIFLPLGGGSNFSLILSDEILRPRRPALIQAPRAPRRR